MIQFSPPLSSSVVVTVPPTLIPDSLLRLHATLSRDEYEGLYDTKIQAWSNVGATEEWSEVTFERFIEDNEEAEATEADLSLLENSSNPPAEQGARNEPDVVRLVATAPLPPLVGRVVQFTYRLMHASGQVEWLGSEGTNGRIHIERMKTTTTDAEAEDDKGDVLKAEDWSQEESEEGAVFSFNVPLGSDPLERPRQLVAKLSGDAKWRGWAIGKEGPSRFTAFTSAVTERVALALLPEVAHPGVHATFAPVLYYTTGDATLSLTDRGEVCLHPGSTDAVLYASTLAAKWPKSIGETAAAATTTVLDAHSPHFVGVSLQNSASHIGSVHFLPISDSARPTVVTVDSDHLTSLVSSAPSLVALVDPTSFTASYLKAGTSPSGDGGCSRPFRVTVGPSGGELLVLPVFSLHGHDNECSMVFLPHGPGSVTAVATDIVDKEASPSQDATPGPTSGEEGSESKDTVAAGAAANGQSGGEQSSALMSDELFLIVVQLVRFVLQLVGGSMILSQILPDAAVLESSRAEGGEQSLPQEAKEQPAPTLTFDVTGTHTLVIKGKDVSKVNITLNGNPVESTIAQIAAGEGSWSITGGDPSTRPAHLKLVLNE